MAPARGSFPVALAALAAVAAWSCGGAPSPVSPVVSPTPSPQPTPTPIGNGGGASASSCPIGKGRLSAPCQKLSPQLLAQMEAAIDLLVRERPEIFNRREEAGQGTGQYRVLDAEAYLDGLVANLRAAGLCAERSVDRERVVAKSTNEFSEEWDVLTSTGFIRRGRYSYVHTCSPASFPVDPADVIAYVRTAFFSFECPPGIAAPSVFNGKMPVGCDGYVTASPKLQNGDNVPPYIHGPDIEWELRNGEDVVKVEDDWRFKNPFNKILRSRGVVGNFALCATVLGKEGCLRGRTIP